ncbi:MAG TPA: hypothetical protein VGP72_11755 [Planctomycetota bacterium]|jgi:hypothetical protein
MRNLLSTALLAVCASAVSAADIRIDSTYLVAGEKTKGVATLATSPLPKDASVRITLTRETDVPSEPGAKGGTVTEEIANQPLADATFPFELTTKGMLTGRLRVLAELLEGKNGPCLEMAWGPVINVGVRRRVDLAGDWSVVKIDPLLGDVRERPKNWVPPTPPATIVQPGPLPFDAGFRGWVTLKREASWKDLGDLKPRLIHLSGISDSAVVQVNGQSLGETYPVEDMAVLTHWVEFHSPYKGPENAQKRLMLMDLGVQDPVTLALPKALDGKGEIELKIRGTSGLFAQKPPYGILGEMYLAATPGIYIKNVSFDTEMVAPASVPAGRDAGSTMSYRRFKFHLVMGNDTGSDFKGNLRAAYGRYAGKTAYTAPCPEYAEEVHPLVLAKGESTVEITRDETPRFDTCRATFMAMDGSKVLDAESCDFHTVTVEIRNRRDLFLNNERFFVKGQGSWGEDPNSRLQLRLKGGNAFRSHRSDPSKQFPGMVSAAENINSRLADGLLTSAGGALLASCERCAFWNPQDTSNISKAVKFHVRQLYACPGLILWEATNELFGEPEEARLAIQEAFHKLDPYHRPMTATKGSGEWEAEAKDGRVAGVDIVGCQYLLSKEALNSVTAAITEHPIMSTEVNWNDMALLGKNLWKEWLDKGVCGSLLFDYSGNALNQPAPMIPPPEQEQNYPWDIMRRRDRALYQDLVATAKRQTDGRVRVTVGNQMPFTLRKVSLSVKELARFSVPDLSAGDAATIILPPEHSPPLRSPVVLRAEYQTHGGLPSMILLTPVVVAETTKEGGKK